MTTMTCLETIAADLLKSHDIQDIMLALVQAAGIDKSTTALAGAVEACDETDAAVVLVKAASQIRKLLAR